MSGKQAACCGSATVIWVLAVVMAVVHNDLWWWNDNTLVLGFMPTGLAFHALFSLVAAGLWVLAIKVAWPHHLEAMAEDAGSTVENIPTSDIEKGDAVGEM